MALFFKCESFQILTFKFLQNLGLSNRSVGKHLYWISLKSAVALSTHWSLNPGTSWFFDFKLEPTLRVTRQNMQWYLNCPKMPRTTIWQRWSVIAPNRTGMRVHFKTHRDSTEGSIWRLRTTCRQAQWSQRSPSQWHTPHGDVSAMTASWT